MRTALAIVQPVVDVAIREINALEGRIVATEDDADDLLWEQASQVVAQLDAGVSQRQLAAQWINVRTGEPYSVAHVNYTAKVHRVKFTEQPRPRFRDCYNAFSNNPSNRLVHNSGDFEWYTPADYIAAARSVLGAIDLDPASTTTANAVVQAATFYSLEDDGLAHDWHGRVWMNPPYVNALVTQFCEKLAASVQAGTVTAAIVLVNNATDTQWFRTLIDVAPAICFPTGRVRFWKPAQTTDAPLQGQAVCYVGPAVGRFVEAFRPFGVVLLNPRPNSAPVHDGHD
jgi:phage N-6-adenine-methyltransferase